MPLRKSIKNHFSWRSQDLQLSKAISRSEASKFCGGENVRRGEKVTASVEYFYEEDAPGATYDNLGFFVEEILVALASSAAGVVPIGEGTLTNIALGNTGLTNQVTQLLNNSIDTTDMSKPHAYMVYLAFDSRNQLVSSNSGAIQVTDPNQLRTILTNEITVAKDGFMHFYVSNGSSAKGVNFDNFMMTSVTGKTRQINHYYPYGLPIADIDGNYNDYLNKYTSKEHQTSEYQERGINAKGLEMFDFHARFWEPQLARWTSPDPAMQFSNPYLGIANNPVNYVDPDGKKAFLFFGIKKALGLKTAAGAKAKFAATKAKFAKSKMAAASKKKGYMANNGAPPDGYILDEKKQRLFRISDEGSSEGLDFIYQGEVFSNGKYSMTGRFFTQKMGKPAIMKPVDGATLQKFNYVSTEGARYIIPKMANIPATTLNTSIGAQGLQTGAATLGPAPLTGGGIQTGLTAFGASQSAKNALISWAGAGAQLPAWYKTLGTRVGQAGAATNMILSYNQYQNQQITGAKLTYDVGWSGLGASPHPLAQWYYWNGVAGQYFGPSTWGWEMFGQNSYYGRLKSWIHNP
jgi:RHS repeat-associated protein